MSDFVHLHLHTEFSLLDGLGKIDDYMRRAVEYGMSHVAISDHGVMYGVLDWYKAAREHGVSPIVGVEAYLAPTRMQDRESRSSYHLLLLAENERGYRNLLKLSSKASTEGFYYRPRIDLELLNELREGLICTSACLGGPVANNYLEGRDEEAERLTATLREMFGPERFYLEVQDHGLPEQHSTNKQIIDLAKRSGVPLVATNDVHYVDQQDASIQDLLVCIQTNTTIDDPKRMRMESDQFFFKSPQQMEQLFGHLPEALSNTARIAERCSFDVDFGRLHLPRPDIPDGMTDHEYLAQVCWQGLERKYPFVTDEIRQRLEYELYVIEQTGFASYMLIVGDFARFARENGIPFGVRGSAAASIVLYTLDITDIDPIANRLVFERFLNLERREMPDIDMDFADNRRAEVIEYAANKYGRDRVAQIITFGTMGAKASVRDVGRALGWSHTDVDRIARLIPSTLNMSLERALTESSDLRNLYESDDRCRTLIDNARRLEGIARHAGTHAAGVVISADPLIEHVPVQRSARGDQDALPTTQFSMETVAEIGLLKMDFLGLANLTILGEAVEIIKQTRGESLDPKTFPDGDPATYEMLAKGETFGVFQLESAGMRRAIQELRPGSIAELAAMVALYRPGPMQHIPTFCRAKHGLEEIRYPHPDLASVLDETYGVIVYQDQVLLIARQFAGYTLGAADVMRKAMGKKIPEKMRAERERFTQGALDKGYSAVDAAKVFDLIEPFAGYAFNKAHAVCYGTIAFQTAYLKANYPAEYMTAVLRLAPSHPSGAAERVAAAVAECGKLGIDVLAPDINRSGVQFNVEVLPDGRQAIRFGLSIIKNVGETAISAVCAARDSAPGGRFASLNDVLLAVDHGVLNKRVVESLIRGGAFDEFGERGALLGTLDSALAAASAVQKARQRGQMGLFGATEVDLPVAVQVAAAGPPVAKKTLLAWEKEYLGTYLSDHPLTDVTHAARAARESFQLLSDLDAEMVGQNVRLITIVSGLRRMTTKTNRTMAVAQVEDLSGSAEVVFFPDAYERCGDVLREEAIVSIKGRVDHRNESFQVIAEECAEFDVPEAVPDVERHIVKITIPVPDGSNETREQLQTLSNLIREFPGDDELTLALGSNGRRTLLKSSRKIDWCPDLRAALEELLGPDCAEVATVLVPANAA
jgi:DNA polymerase III subunit alpha